MHSLAIVPILLLATWQTILMVLASSLLGVGLGLVLGIVLFLAGHKHLNDQPILYQLLGFIVNVTRSVPFIILLIGIIPLTRFLVGTSIGTAAAIVPLTLAAIPFYARIAESAFEEVPHGLLETSRAMGASRWQFISRMLVPEAIPALVKGATLTVIGLVGYSAMAGAVGGGGLGELAINYGYQRFDVWVMLQTVVILVVLVQFIQWLGDRLALRRKVLSVIVISVVILLGGLGLQSWLSKTAEHELRVGVIAGSSEKVMAVAKKVAQQRYHLNLKVISFDDYILPNTVLANGQLDANIFQHIPYLNTQIKARGYAITPLAKTFIYPMGFFSLRYHSLQDLKLDDLVAIPNDPSNEGRALLLLQNSGLIQLRDGVGLLATPRDIVVNKKQLRFKLIPAAQCPRALPDVAMAALTNDFVAPAGYELNQALIHEQADAPYANVIVVRTADKNNLLLQQLVDVMHSPDVIAETMRLFPGGGAIVAWK